MEQITTFAHAKINLSLDILQKRLDGFHLIDSVMHSLSLADKVEIAADDDKIHITCDNEKIPQDEQNIAYQAAISYFRAAHLTVRGVHINIHKHIPTQAGLGGGSADAAAVLFGLSLLYPAGLSQNGLLRVASSIGADVPFCFTGGCKRVRGIGERLSPLPTLPECVIVLAKPPKGVSTKEAYDAYDARETTWEPKTPALCDALETHNLRQISQQVSNAFVDTLSPATVPALCKAMRKAGAFGATMSGSGSTVFGLFPSYILAENCMRALKESNSSLFVSVCSPAPAGLSTSHRTFESI